MKARYQPVAADESGSLDSSALDPETLLRSHLRSLALTERRASLLAAKQAEHVMQQQRVVRLHHKVQLPA